MKQYDSVIRKIVELYGGKKIELNYETPFQLLCAVILSAQTTDKQVNKITPPFFLKVREPKDVMNMPLREIEEYFKQVNFFRNKSKYIKLTGEKIAVEFDGEIPNNLSLIQTFPWVGIKTAKVILSVLYDRPYVWVDTHIHRVMNRIGIVQTKTPEQTDLEIERIFSDEVKYRMHHPLVLFGRYTCTARNPRCPSCPIQKECSYYRKNFL